MTNGHEFATHNYSKNFTSHDKPPKKIIHIFSIEDEHWFFFFLLKCRISAKASYSGRRILYKALEIRFSKKKKKKKITQLKKWKMKRIEKVGIGNGKE